MNIHPKSMLDAVPTALTHLLAVCETGHPDFGLPIWSEYYQKAVFVGASALVLDNEVEAGTARVLLRERGDLTAWTLVFGEDGALTNVKGACPDALADTAWHMLRLIAEGSATAAVIGYPAEWYEAGGADGARDRARRLALL
jgi:hypothetical protein